MLTKPLLSRVCLLKTRDDPTLLEFECRDERQLRRACFVNLPSALVKHRNRPLVELDEHTSRRRGELGSRGVVDLREIVPVMVACLGDVHYTVAQGLAGLAACGGKTHQAGRIA